MNHARSIPWLVFVGLATSTACIELYEHHPPTCRERRLAVCPGDGGIGGDSGGEAGASAGSGDGGSGTSGSAGSAAGDAGRGGAAGAGASGGSEPCNGECGGRTPVCDETRDTCVECLESTDCSEPTSFCDVAAQSCVECRRSSDCTASDASRCSEGRCESCESNADCTHLAGLGVCDAASGACVECTLQTEAMACGANSCNPATNECTTTPRGSVQTCEPCVADSECAGASQASPDARCVPMEFQGRARPGGFCLRRAARTCARPYTIAILAPSLSGAAEENYCGIDQTAARCEAILDLERSRTCPSGTDTSCGCPRDMDDNCVSTGQGGLCRDFVTLDDQCTYACGVDNDCPAGRRCLGTPTKFCQ